MHPEFETIRLRPANADEAARGIAMIGTFPDGRRIRITSKREDEGDPHWRLVIRAPRARSRPRGSYPGKMRPGK